MDGAIALERHEEEAAEAISEDTPSGVSQPRLRETILLWCIGSVFGAGMLALLVGMCLAEISIHRDMTGTATAPVDSSPVTLAATH
jgi:hypothetical protein